MTTPTGTISLTDVQAEFGGSNPIGMNEYYQGGTYVPSGISGIPTSGTISMDNLRGKSKSGITPNYLTISENSSVTFSVTNLGVADGTYYWGIDFNSSTDSSDFTSTTGSFSIVSGNGSFNVSTALNIAYEGNQTFKAYVCTDPGLTNILITSVAVTITETQAYSVDSPDYFIVEGQNFYFNISTTNVPDGTVVYYTVEGNNSLDWASAISGACAPIYSNYSENYIISNHDNTDESSGVNAEPFTVNIRSGSVLGPVIASLPSQAYIFDRVYWMPNNVINEGGWATLYLGEPGTSGEVYNYSISTNNSMGYGIDSVLGTSTSGTFTINTTGTTALFTLYANYLGMQVPAWAGGATSTYLSATISKSGFPTTTTTLTIYNTEGEFGPVVMRKYGGTSPSDPITVTMELTNIVPYGYSRTFQIWLSGNGDPYFQHSSSITVGAYSSGTGEQVIYYTATITGYLYTMDTQVRFPGYITAQANQLTNFFI